jgi:hypothetical protein
MKSIAEAVVHRAAKMCKQFEILEQSPANAGVRISHCTYQQACAH